MSAYTYLGGSAHNTSLLSTGTVITSWPPFQVLLVRRMSRYRESTLPLLAATPSAGMACETEHIFGDRDATVIAHLISTVTQWFSDGAASKGAEGAGFWAGHVIAHLPLGFDDIAEYGPLLHLRKSCYCRNSLQAADHLLSNV